MRVIPVTSRRAGFVLCLTILGTWSGGHAQEPALPQAVDTALYYFLNVDCQTKSPLDHLVEVRNAQPKEVRLLLDQRLISTLNDGPDKRTVDKFRAVLQDQWERRTAFLKKNP